MKTIAKHLLNPRPWGYFLFWSWNAIFLAFMLLGFAPRLLPELINAARAGFITVEFLINGVIVTLIPIAAVILGATVLRREPLRLFALGYAVEGPLMLILLLRFFVIRDLTPSVAFLGVL